jgi:hypothetical protein
MQYGKHAAAAEYLRTWIDGTAVVISSWMYSAATS